MDVIDCNKMEHDVTQKPVPTFWHYALGFVENHLELIMAEARLIMALKLWSVLQARMAIRLNSLSLQKKFSIRCRHLYIQIDVERLGAAGVLGDDDLGAALLEFGDDGVAVESLVGDQSVEVDAIDQGRDADRVKPLPWQENKPNQAAVCVR